MSEPPRAVGARSPRSGRTGAREAVPNLVAAVVLGLFQLLLAISLSALVYSGPLSPYVARGIGFTLVGSIAIAVVVALLATIPGTFGGSQNSTGAIIAVIVGQVAVTASAGAGDASDPAFATTVAAIAFTSLVTGLFLLGLGRFRLGNLVRFLPFPIMGGFLAGTGWLLSVGAIGMMTGIAPRLHDGFLLLAPAALAQWLPGLLLALVMLVTTARVRASLALPGVILGALALFYLVVWASGTTVAELGAGGWLLGPFPRGDLWQPLSWAEWGAVDWGTILGQMPAIATILPVTAVAVLLNAGGIELAVKEDASLNRELGAAGVANLLAGSLGGLVGFQQVGVSTLAARLGARSRSVALLAAAVVAAALLTGASGLSLLPRFLLGGMLLYIGLGFLHEWLVSAWFHLPRLEYAVVLTIVVVIAAAGFIEGVAVGVVAAVILFVVAYSRVDVVRHELDGAHVASRVNRHPHHREILRSKSSRLHVFHLQGFVFFGTADMLLRRVRGRIEGGSTRGRRFMVLDFRRVTGIDSTATRSFLKMRQVASSHDAMLVLTDVPPAVREALTARGLPEDPHVRFMSDLDSGLEWCEKELLREAEGGPADRSGLQPDFASLLPEGRWGRLRPYLHRATLRPGEYLIRQGDAPDRMFFVENGTLTARLERGDGPPLRLETMGGGSVLGELGFFLQQPRSASVVAEEESRVLTLERDAFERMQREDPQLALSLHRLVARMLSERVGHLMGVVGALER